MLDDQGLAKIIHESEKNILIHSDGVHLVLIRLFVMREMKRGLRTTKGFFVFFSCLAPKD